MTVKHLVDRNELAPKNTEANITKLLEDLHYSVFYHVTKALDNMYINQQDAQNSCD